MSSLFRALAPAAAIVFSPALLAVHGCGSTISVPLADAGTSSCGTETCTPTTDAGTLPCGTETCGPGQICIEPCCGGAPLDCIELPPDGECPPGYGLVDSCSSPNGVGGAGLECEEIPCEPDPPKCIDIPSACPSELTCECMPADSCAHYDDCWIDGRTVSCACY